MIGVFLLKFFISYLGVFFVFGIICQVLKYLLVYFVEFGGYVVLDFFYDLGDIDIYVIDIVKLY